MGSIWPRPKLSVEERKEILRVRKSDSKELNRDITGGIDPEMIKFMRMRERNMTRLKAAGKL